MAMAFKSSFPLLQTEKPRLFAFSSRKSEWSQTMTFSQPKYCNATAAAMPMVPAPNTTAFSPLLGRERLAARQPTVNGLIRLAAFEGILSLTA